MNKFIIGGILLAAIVIGWFIISTPSVTDYVAAVDTEITELETDLAEISAQVLAGTLTEEAATKAKVRIVNRLDAITSASASSEAAQLTPAQRIQLAAGLERLKNILITYQGTLNNVEATANETNVSAELARRGGGSYNRSKHLNLVVADAIADVEATVADSIQDFEPNAELDGQIDVVVDETQAQVAAEAMIEAEAQAAIDADQAEGTTEEVTTEETTATTPDEEEPSEETPTDEESTDPVIELEAVAETETTPTSN